MAQYDPLLDRYAANQFPDVITFLALRYREAMERKNEELREQARLAGGNPDTAAQINIGNAVDEIATFINFSREYLGKHRPVQLSYPDQNYCIMLENHESFLVSPPVEQPVRGTMQASSSVGVTGYQTRDEIASAAMGAVPVTQPSQPRRQLPVDHQGTVPVTTGHVKTPQGYVDKSLPTKLQDQRAHQPMRRLDL